MTDLSELAGSTEGAALLTEEGVFLDRESFVHALRPPARGALVQLARSPGGEDGSARPLVYVGHQLCVDYGGSVVAKLAVLGELQAEHDLSGCAVWVDTDRAGSDKRMTVISWPRHDGRKGVPLAPPGSKDREPRFIRLEHAELMKAFDRLRTYLGESKVDALGLERYAQLRAALDQAGPSTLAELGAQVTDLLLAAYGIDLAAVRLSELLRTNELTDEVEACLNALPRVIEALNRAVSDLREHGVDPLVHPVSADYLPLRIACPADGTRLPLRRRDEAGDTYAVATCRCGVSHRFRLGRGTLSLEELAQSRRWSPDVLLPTFLNDMASGVVAGKSSAIYGLVLNRVLREALGKEPIPMLVPEDLVSRNSRGPRLTADSLMVSYLLGS